MEEQKAPPDARCLRRGRKPTPASALLAQRAASEPRVAADKRPDTLRRARELAGRALTPSHPPRFPFFFDFFFFSLRRRHPPPTPGNDRWSPHLVDYRSHAKHSDSTCSVSCSRTGSAPRHTVRHRPPHTANPTPDILSAHAHGRGVGTTQGRRPWRVQGHPNTTHHGCSAART